jgi:hypothetical protein
LFSRGRSNEHHGQHLLGASQDLRVEELFHVDGTPAVSFDRIAQEFDWKYRRLEAADDAFPPDRRGKRNPTLEHGKDRIWHCSLAVKAGQGILTDQRWNRIVEDYLKELNLIGEHTPQVTWLAVRHGLSRNGNDHVHVVVQLACEDGWVKSVA